MRFLLGHSYAHSGTFGREWLEAWAQRLRDAGTNVDLIQIGMDVPGRRLSFPELDRRWRRGDRDLMQLYERIAARAEGYDVLINAGALNLHPEFLRQLPLITVLRFNDGPESNEHAEPVALAHDLCCTGNIAEPDIYRSWGVQQVYWTPIGFMADDYDPALTEDTILTRARSVDVSLLCERITSFRRAKVDRFATAFPQGVYRGPGWPKGFLPEAQRIPLLQDTKIGINIHNSTGPINFRTYYLPANGVLQICDNKSHLGGIFELNKEVVGYDSIDEAIELTRYYLAHEEERRAIAAAGWRRSLRDYNEVAAFDFVRRAVESYKQTSHAREGVAALIPVLQVHAEKTRSRRWAFSVVRPFYWAAHVLGRVPRGLARRISLRWANIALRFQRTS